VTARDADCARLAEMMGWTVGPGVSAVRGYWFTIGPGEFLDIPAPDAPLPAQLEFVGRIAEAMGEPPLCLWPTDTGWCVSLGEAQATAPDLAWAAVKAAIASKGAT